MVYSEKYNYLFVQLPRTGNTAISKELIENYSGQRILKKHSKYKEFIKKYGIKENLFVFG